MQIDYAGIARTIMGHAGMPEEQLFSSVEACDSIGPESRAGSTASRCSIPPCMAPSVSRHPARLHALELLAVAGPDKLSAALLWCSVRNRSMSSCCPTCCALLRRAGPLARISSLFGSFTRKSQSAAHIEVAPSGSTDSPKKADRRAQSADAAPALPPLSKASAPALRLPRLSIISAAGGAQSASALPRAASATAAARTGRPTGSVQTSGNSASVRRSSPGSLSSNQRSPSPSPRRRGGAATTSRRNVHASDPGVGAGAAAFKSQPPMPSEFDEGANHDLLVRQPAGPIQLTSQASSHVEVNSGKEVEFDGPLFRGKIAVWLQGVPQQEGSEDVFEGKKRQSWIVIQGRFKERVSTNECAAPRFAWPCLLVRVDASGVS